MTAESIDFSVSPELRADLGTWRTRALGVGIAGAVLCAIGFFVAGPFQFYRSYLWSYVLLVGLALGSMAWLML